MEIEPYSQGYVDQTQLRQDMTEAFQMVLAIMQAAAMDPTLKPEPMINDLLQTLNIPRPRRSTSTRCSSTPPEDARNADGDAGSGDDDGRIASGAGQPPGVPAAGTSEARGSRQAGERSWRSPSGGCRRVNRAV